MITCASYLQVMLNQSDIMADSQWTTVQPQLSRLAAFAAVRSQEDRQQLFQEYVTDLQVPLLVNPDCTPLCWPAGVRNLKIPIGSRQGLIGGQGGGVLLQAC